MEPKFIRLEGLSGKKHIVNTSAISSVHEDSKEGMKYLIVNLTDEHVLYISMSIDDFYNLIASSDTSESI
jgi:hypothetical protein